MKFGREVTKRSRWIAANAVFVDNVRDCRGAFSSGLVKPSYSATPCCPCVNRLHCLLKRPPTRDVHAVTIGKSIGNLRKEEPNDKEQCTSCCARKRVAIYTILSRHREQCVPGNESSAKPAHNALRIRRIALRSGDSSAWEKANIRRISKSRRRPNPNPEFMFFEGTPAICVRGVGLMDQGWYARTGNGGPRLEIWWPTWRLRDQRWHARSRNLNCNCSLRR